MSETSVQLHEAFCFHCPKCGYANLVHGVILDDPTHQEAAQKFMYDSILQTEGEAAAQQWDGQLMVSPDRVTCSSCNSSFPVEHREMLSFFDDDPNYDPDLDLEDDDDFEDEWDGSEEWGDDDFDDDEDDFDEEVDEDEYDLRGPVNY